MELYDEYGNAIDEHELPPVYDSYFAGTDDEHTANGEPEPAYAGPSLQEIGEAFALLTAKQQFVLSRRLGLAGDAVRYTQAEVAEAMGVTVGAIEFIEARARKALRANAVGLDERLLAA